MADEIKTLFVFRGQAVMDGTLAWTWMFGQSARSYEIRSDIEGRTQEAAIEAAKDYASKNKYGQVVVLKQGGNQDYIINL